MLFQALDYKRNNFFNLLDNKYLSIKPIYTKDSAWLELFEHSNLLYARTTRAITNHAPIGKYCLMFFPKELFEYLCRLYSIKLRCYILYEYRRYNNHCNFNREFLEHFVVFLKFNPDVFSFYEDIT